MAKQQSQTRPTGLSREDEILAYVAIVVLVAGIGVTIGAIFVG